MKIYRSIDLGAMELSEKLSQEADIDIHFEPMSDNDLLTSDFDLIELSEQQNQSILATMPMLEWQIQSTLAVDAFEKKEKVFKPLQLGSNAFIHFLESKHISLDTTKSAVVIGNYSFLISYAMALFKLGFKRIYLVSPEGTSFAARIKSIKKILFDIELIQINFEEMAHISELASALIINFDLTEHPEFVQTLTYFNFLAENAIFFDVQNYLNDSLSLEAEKASLRVLDSVEFHLYKYRLVQKKLNNHS